MRPCEHTLAAARGLRVIVDAAEIYPDDPGQGQPVRVETTDGRYSASWDCAMGTGELSGTSDYVTLTAAQNLWLDSIEPLVETWRRENKV